MMMSIAASSAATSFDSDDRPGRKRRHSSSAEEGELSFHQEDDILARIAHEGRGDTGTPVAQVLKELVEGFFVRDFTSKSFDNQSTLKHVLKKFEEVPILSNLVDILKPAETNEPIARAAFKDPKARKMHHEVVKSEGCLARIVCSQVKVIEQLVQLKKSLATDEQVMNGDDIKTFKSSVDGIIRQAALGVEFLGLEKFNLTQIRKEAVVSAINPNYRSLGEQSKSHSDQLFGDDLGRRVQDIETANKLSKKFEGERSSQAKSFLGRGHHDHHRHHRGRSLHHNPHHNHNAHHRLPSPQHQRGKKAGNQNYR
jgi:hypothetical protein